MSNRVGGTGRPFLLSHHRTCGSASGGSANVRTPILHQSSSPCWQSVPGMALPSGYLVRASPSPPYQQCLYSRQSAFYVHSTNFLPRTHLPFSPSRFLPTTLGTMASADSWYLSLILQLELRLTPHDTRSPQLRTLTFSAHLPDLRLCPLMTWTS
jgi:hypothetical protein